MTKISMNEVTKLWGIDKGPRGENVSDLVTIVSLGVIECDERRGGAGEEYANGKEEK